MRSRFLFLFITLFWLTMNFLLWRSEFGGHQKVGSAVSLDVVVEKILTAPDASSLEVYHHGNKIGFCRLAMRKPSKMELCGTFRTIKVLSRTSKRWKVSCNLHSALRLGHYTRQESNL